MAQIDDDLIRSVIAEACGVHATLDEAACAGVFVVKQRDLAIELAMPLAPRAAQRLVQLPWASRCTREDVEQAALLGLVEAVGNYQHARLHKGRPVKPSTHFFWRIRKRVIEEIQDTHWIIAKPTRADIEAYMKGEMTEGQRSAYVDAVIRPVDTGARS